MEQKNQNPLELYFHIPFCIKKCAYCDFLSFSAEKEMREQYVQKLCEEVWAVQRETQRQEQEEEQGKRRVVTIFFGGGTPSLLEPEQIAVILDVVRQCYDVAENAEISMEMNPGTLGEQWEDEERRLLGYRTAGVNRISFGLQSAHNEELRVLGRIHTWEQFLQSFQCARKAGFTNINVDLMSALPEQTMELWETSLRKTAELEPEHISAYSLIIEEGTPFYERYAGKGQRFLPDEETERRMYAQTEQILKEYGYFRYEISNYAKEKKECRHNLGYWTGAEYLGFGIGASSYYQGYRFSNTDKIQEYFMADLSQGVQEIRREVHQVTESEKMEEFMFLGLRLTKGVRASDFFERFGRQIELIYEKELKQFISLGLMEKVCFYEQGANTVYYRLTEQGISVSNQVMCEFLEPNLGI